MNRPNVIELYPREEESSAEIAQVICAANSHPLWVFDQESFRHAQKMEAMGRLAAGVAHDFYNILTVIQGYAALLARGQKTRQEINEQLGHISSAAGRGAILTRQLLAYSRRDPLQFEPLDLNGLIDNMASMLTRLLGENITLQHHGGANLKPILGDQGMLEQLLMNLMVNARDAIANEGKIAISTDVVQVGPAHVERFPQAKSGEFICLSVCDTGCGMGQAVIARLFEPFFTTKTPEKGTGLGLAMARNIVDQHSGWVEVRSQVAVGTEFKVYLPCAPEVALRKKRKTHAPCLSAGNETILIVESDPQLRGLTAYILRFHGYQVVEAEGVEQALAKGSQADLALIDLSLPGTLSGRQLAEKLCQGHSRLKVVFTGGPGSMRADDIEIREKPNFVAKPFLPDTLVQAVQDTLAGRC